MKTRNTYSTRRTYKSIEPSWLTLGQACILIAMVVMEALFGFGGVALAPVVYAYIKSELKAVDLI